MLIHSNIFLICLIWFDFKIMFKDQSILENILFCFQIKAAWLLYFIKFLIHQVKDIHKHSRYYFLLINNNISHYPRIAIDLLLSIIVISNFNLFNFPFSINFLFK